VSFSIAVLAITPTHLYTTSALSSCPDLRSSDSAPMRSMASPSISVAPRRSSHFCEYFDAASSKPGRIVFAMSTKVTCLFGYTVRISPASSTPTAPAPTMMTDCAAASLAAAPDHDTSRSASVPSDEVGLIGSEYVEPTASSR